MLTLFDEWNSSKNWVSKHNFIFLDTWYIISAAYSILFYLNIILLTLIRLFLFTFCSTWVDAITIAFYTLQSQRTWHKRKKKDCRIYSIRIFAVSLYFLETAEITHIQSHESVFQMLTEQREQQWTSHIGQWKAHEAMIMQK